MKGPNESRDLSQPPVIRRMSLFTFLLFVSCILLIVFPLRKICGNYNFLIWFAIALRSFVWTLLILTNFGFLGNRIVSLHVALIILITCLNLLTSLLVECSCQHIYTDQPSCSVISGWQHNNSQSAVNFNQSNGLLISHIVNSSAWPGSIGSYIIKCLYSYSLTLITSALPRVCFIAIPSTKNLSWIS